MNLLRLINEEPIGGLEISDTHLRFSLLRKNKSAVVIKTLAEEILADQTLEGGLIKNEAAFLTKVKQFAGRYRIKYVVLSLSADQIFTKIYSFPTVMPDEKMEESINLIIDFQLPKKRADIYCDWEKSESTKDKKILLSYANRPAVDNLMTKAEKIGLKVVAVESHGSSLARAIKQKTNEVLLVLERGRSSTSFFVIKNHNLLFSQTLPTDKIAADLPGEIAKIINYQEWLGQTITNLALLGNFNPEEIKNLPLKPTPLELKEGVEQKIKIKPEALISMGAAWRGLMPRKDDKIISLMKIGTEEAFRQAKANATLGFLIGISIALSLFFTAALTALWLMLTIMQNNFNEQIISLTARPDSKNAALIETQAIDFNELVGQTGALVKEEPRWSAIVEEIKARIVPGIAINTLSLPGTSVTWSLTGVADSREEINALKKSFEDSPLFKEVNLPLDNLGKKTDIPFSLMFKVSAPELIYRHQ